MISACFILPFSGFSSRVLYKFIQLSLKMREVRFLQANTDSIQVNEFIDL